MKAVNEQIKKENPILSNSADIKQFIYEMAEKYSECDEESAKLNEERQSIRDRIKDKGISVKAFLHEYQYYKLANYEVDGYDDGRAICNEALSKAKNGDLFAWKAEKEAKQAEARAKQKAAKEPKTKKKDIGQQQAEAYQAAHGKAA